MKDIENLISKNEREKDGCQLRLAGLSSYLWLVVNPCRVHCQIKKSKKEETMEQRPIDKVIGEYQERHWKYCLRKIHDDPPVEDDSIATFNSEAPLAAQKAEWHDLPEEFLFRDLEYLSARLEHPELEVYGESPGPSSVCRLTEDWQGHKKGKLALAFFVLENPKDRRSDVIHLWLIEE